MIEDKDKQIKELEEQLEDYKTKYKKLKKEFEHTKKEFEEFKAKHNQTVSELRKALKIKAVKKGEPKPVGAKLGHKGYTRHVPERIDYIKVLNPKRCPHCKTKLGRTQEIRSRHVTDIKLIGKVKNTRYDIHRKTSPKGKSLEGREGPKTWLLAGLV